MHLAPTVIISENNCVPDYFFSQVSSLQQDKKTDFQDICRAYLIGEIVRITSLSEFGRGMFGF